MTMGTWKTRKHRQGKNASRTAGKDKGAKCRTNPIKKFYACHPHACRLNPKQYSQWHAKFVASDLGD